MAESRATEGEYVSELTLEQLTGIKRKTWQKHRLFGRGPAYYRLCGAIRYRLSEVVAWIEANAVRPRP
jgi:predicted DNA-binding transcriptional regulator AlpA